MALLSRDRFGRSPIRTTSDLQKLLTIPVYLYLIESASLVYPGTSPASPSSMGGFVGGKNPVPDWLGGRGGLPLWVPETQWRTVVVPLLEDPRIYYWRKKLRTGFTPWEVPVDVTGPEGSVAWRKGLRLSYKVFTGEGPGSLFACDPNDLKRLNGKTRQFIDLLGNLVGEYSAEAGFGGAV
jgi:hypothetical protein